MPKNKKPRKHYVPRWVHRPLPPEDVRRIREKFTAVQLAMELKLHLGTCTPEEITDAIDMYNLAGLSLVNRGYELDDESVALFNAGSEALAAVKNRGLKMEPVRFVCTGDERNAILNGLEPVGEYLMEAANEDASTLMLEWRALHFYGENHEKH